MEKYDQYATAYAFATGLTEIEDDRYGEKFMRRRRFVRKMAAKKHSNRGHRS